MIVQHLPTVIEAQETVGGVEAVAYDFFTPQPIKGNYLQELIVRYGLCGLII